MSSSTKPARRSPPQLAPARVDSTRALKRLQRAVWSVISRPLSPGHRTQRRWVDGRPTAAVVEQFIKPNDRLTAFERLQIYNRTYWFRVLECLYDDCPGLRAVLGERKFMRLAEAYLAKNPSRSFSLRNLPRRLAAFIRAEPRWTHPHTALCLDVARFEWAQVEVYDNAAYPVFTTDDLLDANPARLRLNLQPYLQLLQLRHSVDDFIIAVKKHEALLRGDASNTPTAAPPAAGRRAKKVPRPRPGRCCVAVHRYQDRIYFKRLEPAAYKVLTALRAGRTLSQALAAGIPRAQQPREDWAAKVRGWFQTWMELGWFCRR